MDVIVLHVPHGFEAIIQVAAVIRPLVVPNNDRSVQYNEGNWRIQSARIAGRWTGLPVRPRI